MSVTSYRVLTGSKEDFLLAELKDKSRVPLHDPLPFQVSRSFDGADRKGEGQELLTLRI